MLSIATIKHLSYQYMLYRSLDLELPYWKLTKDHLFFHGQHLLQDHGGILTVCTNSELMLFCEDLAKAISAIPTPFSFTAYSQEKSVREHIAFHYALAATKREGPQHIAKDTLLIPQFASITSITKAESEAFFSYIVEACSTGIPQTLRAVS